MSATPHFAVGVVNSATSNSDAAAAPREAAGGNRLSEKECTRMSRDRRLVPPTRVLNPKARPKQSIQHMPSAAVQTTGAEAVCVSVVMQHTRKTVITCDDHKQFLNGKRRAKRCFHKPIDTSGGGGNARAAAAPAAVWSRHRYHSYNSYHARDSARRNAGLALRTNKRTKTTACTWLSVFGRKPPKREKNKKKGNVHMTCHRVEQ